MARTVRSIAALSVAGLVLFAGTPAHADTVPLAGTIGPGSEDFVSGTLAPTQVYAGKVLVQLQRNPVPVEVRIGNCGGQYLGRVSIAANDHAVFVAATVSAVPPCIRYRVRNLGMAPVTVTGFGYF